MPDAPRPAQTPAECDHPDFQATVNVHRLLDSGRFAADVRIRCVKCKEPFAFLGLEPGVDLDGARVSVDGCEARLSIYPASKIPDPLRGCRGFTIKETDSAH